MFGVAAAILQLGGNKSEDEKPVCLGCCRERMDKAWVLGDFAEPLS